MSDFQDAARRFCDLIESAGEIGPRTFCTLAEDAMVTLYREGSRLPEMGPDTDAAARPMSNAEWQSLFERLEATVHDDVVADALAGIYRDLRAGFELMEAGASPADVLAEWQTSFAIHWGDTCVEAVRRLHQMRDRT